MAAGMERRNVSVSLPTDLVEAVDQWAVAREVNRSAIFAALIKEEQHRILDAQLAQDYRDAVADGFYDDIDTYFHAGAEVFFRDPD